MSTTAQKYVVAVLSLALFAALVLVGTVDARRHAEEARAQAAATAMPLDPQLARGRAVYLKYSCNACHRAYARAGSTT